MSEFALDIITTQKRSAGRKMLTQSGQRLALATRIGSAVGILFAVMKESSPDTNENLKRIFVDPPTMLTPTSAANVDNKLIRLEETYNSKNVDGYMAFFGNDFQSIQINQRVRLCGLDQWRSQTEEMMASHKCVRHRYLGRAVSGDLIVAEVERWGTIYGKVIGPGEQNKHYRYRAIEILSMQENGKISRQLAYSDAGSLKGLPSNLHAVLTGQSAASTELAMVAQEGG